MERKSDAFVNEKIFCGFLEMETKVNSGVFHRRFLRLDPNASTLEYFTDGQQVVCCISAEASVWPSDNYYNGWRYTYSVCTCGCMRTKHTLTTPTSMVNIQELGAFQQYQSYCNCVLL